MIETRPLRNLLQGRRVGENKISYNNDAVKNLEF
jgi:hypothetical protein